MCPDQLSAARSVQPDTIEAGNHYGRCFACPSCSAWRLCATTHASTLTTPLRSPSVLLPELRCDACGFTDLAELFIDYGHAYDCDSLDRWLIDGDQAMILHTAALCFEIERPAPGSIDLRLFQGSGYKLADCDRPRDLPRFRQIVDLVQACFNQRCEGVTVDLQLPSNARWPIKRYDPERTTLWIEHAFLKGVARDMQVGLHDLPTREIFDLLCRWHDEERRDIADPHLARARARPADTEVRIAIARSAALL